MANPNSRRTLVTYTFHTRRAARTFRAVLPGVTFCRRALRGRFGVRDATTLLLGQLWRQAVLRGGDKERQGQSGQSRVVVLCLLAVGGALTLIGVDRTVRSIGRPGNYGDNREIGGYCREGERGPA